MNILNARKLLKNKIIGITCNNSSEKALRLLKIKQTILLWSV